MLIADAEVIPSAEFSADTLAIELRFEAATSLWRGLWLVTVGTAVEEDTGEFNSPSFAVFCVEVNDIEAADTAEAVAVFIGVEGEDCAANVGGLDVGNGVVLDDSGTLSAGAACAAAPPPCPTSPDALGGLDVLDNVGVVTDGNMSVVVALARLLARKIFLHILVSAPIIVVMVDVDMTAPMDHPDSFRSRPSLWS
jgi:hypothetical protein